MKSDYFICTRKVDGLLSWFNQSRAGIGCGKIHIINYHL